MNAPSRSHLMITATSFSRFRNIRRLATRTASEAALADVECDRRHLQLNPEDVRAYGHGAGVLALLGNSDDATRYIAKALAFRPDDHGNLATLACAAALNGDPEQALDLLERAVSAGRGDRESILADNDLKSLHGHPRFGALMQKMA